MFNAKTLQFLKEAGRATKIEWFERNRDRYAKDVKEPFTDLLAALDERFRTEVPHFRFNPRSISRPQRQAGRGAEHEPFKDFVACMMGPRKISRFEYPPCFYLFVSPGEIFFAAGLYMPTSRQMRAIRTAIQANPEELSKLLVRKRFKEIYDGLSPDEMTRLPRGFSVAPKYQHLLMKRSFTVRRDFTAREFAGTRFTQNVIAAAETALPLVLWLERACDGHAEI